MKRLVIPTVMLIVISAVAQAQPPSTDGEQLKCANLIYAVSKSSVCFSDKFLLTVHRETNCEPQRQFIPHL